MNVNSTRACPVCKCTRALKLYAQRFAEIEGCDTLRAYDVVSCSGCGFAFADGIPSQSWFDNYYRTLSKYEDPHVSGAVNVQDEWYKTTAELLSGFIPTSDSSVLDVGCATGGQLRALSALGFQRVSGLDPSPVCARLVASLHGIPAETGSIFDNSLTERYDVVIIQAVLEHVVDLEQALQCLAARVSDGGLLYIHVPDATRFGEHFLVPYQEFSMEHVNYFSPVSLTNLLAAAGFQPVYLDQVIVNMGSGSQVEPGIRGLFRKTPAPPGPPVYDAASADSIRTYVEASARVEAVTQQLVAEIAGRRTPIIVWGTGTYTLHLLATSKLSDANITAYVDSNPKYQGRSIAGVPIIRPEDLPGRPDPILVSTRMYEHEILRQIREVLHLANDVILPYQDAGMD